MARYIVNKGKGRGTGIEYLLDTGRYAPYPWERSMLLNPTVPPTPQERAAAANPHLTGIASGGGYGPRPPGPGLGPVGERGEVVLPNPVGVAPPPSPNALNPALGFIGDAEKTEKRRKLEDTPENRLERIKESEPVSEGRSAEEILEDTKKGLFGVANADERARTASKPDKFKKASQKQLEEHARNEATTPSPKETKVPLSSPELRETPEAKLLQRKLEQESAEKGFSMRKFLDDPSNQRTLMTLGLSLMAGQSDNFFTNLGNAGLTALADADAQEEKQYRRDAGASSAAFEREKFEYEKRKDAIEATLKAAKIDVDRDDAKFKNFANILDAITSDLETLSPARVAQLWSAYERGGLSALSGVAGDGATDVPVVKSYTKE